jgi:F-type H+-transporting ATPase subunit epsilon
MPDGVFTAEVVTPEQRLLSGPARAVILRSSGGDFTVLDGHTPMVTDVVPGEVRVEQEDGTVVHLAVHGGYMQVETGPGVGAGAEADGASPDARGTRVTVLAGVAEKAADIDVPRAERAKEEAEAQVNQLRGAGGRGVDAAATAGGGERPVSAEDLELAEAEAALRRAEVRLQVAGATTASA